MAESLGVPGLGTVSRETSPSPAPASTPDVSRETSPRRPAHVIAVINQKGGVGKTTTAVNLSCDLASRAFRVLLIDLDPQGNASTSLGVDRYAEGITTADALLSPKTGPLPPPLHIGADMPFLYAGTVSLIRADIDLLDRPEGRDRILARHLTPMLHDYDFVIIDSPPSLGLLTLNILIASNSVIIPIQCEYLALEGLSMLLDTLEQIRTTSHPKLDILGCLITMTDLRTNLSQQVVSDVRTHLGDKVFDTMIPRTIRLSECPSHGKSIFQYERWGAGARSYEALADEVLIRLGIAPREKKKGRR